MVEGACLEATEEEFLEAMKVGQEAIVELIAIQQELFSAAGTPENFEYERIGPASELVSRVTEEATQRVEEALRISDKEERGRALGEIRSELTEALEEDFPECGSDVGTVLSKLEKQIMRSRILEDGVRVDGRGPNDIREITSEVSLLPRTHG